MRRLFYGNLFYLIVTGATLLLFLFFAEVELFEWFYNYSRAHENWELDEVASLFLATSLSIPLILYRNNKILKAAYARKTEAEAAARHISCHDALTGLYNRRHLTETLNGLIAQADEGTSISFMLIDLDRFKPINDLHGHAIGDMTLQVVGQRLRKACKEGEEVYRLGGDEFALVSTTSATPDELSRLAAVLLTAIEEEFALGPTKVSLSGSIGISVWKPGTDPAGMIREADQAMYKAKTMGRARAQFFDEDLGASLRQRAQFESDLRHAVENGEIVPYFQPIFSLQDQTILSFEVLARWESPKHGLVGPVDFIPIAEEIGLIGPLSWTVLSAALQQAVHWDEAISIAFNLSPVQFRDEDLVNNMERILVQTRFPGERLVIEITENAIIDDIVRARQTITELRQLGLHTSLDDFGTGFSSLAMLSQLTFDKLKIDRSFISTVTEDAHNARIVEGILAFAATLDMDVTAEGIETTGELDFLNARNCAEGQGFYFAKPLPAAQAAEFLVDRTTQGSDAFRLPPSARS